MRNQESRPSLEEVRLLHDAQEFFFVYLPIAIPISLIQILGGKVKGINIHEEIEINLVEHYFWEGRGNWSKEY